MKLDGDEREMCPMQFIFLHAWVRAAPTAPIQGLMKNNSDRLGVNAK